MRDLGGAGLGNTARANMAEATFANALGDSFF